MSASLISLFLLLISSSVLADVCSTCNQLNAIPQEPLVTVSIAPQFIFNDDTQGNPLIIMPTYNRSIGHSCITLLLCGDPYCSTIVGQSQPYSMEDFNYMSSLSTAVFSEQYFGIASAVDSKLEYWLCSDPMCDSPTYRNLLSSSVSDAQMVYDSVNDRVVIATLYTSNANFGTYPGTVSLIASSSGDYTYNGMISTVTFKQTNWKALSFAGSQGWSTLALSTTSYSLTIYFCNVTDCEGDVNRIGYITGKYSPSDFTVMYAPTDVYVPSLGNSYSGTFPVFTVVYSGHAASITFCLSQLCEQNTTTSIGRSVSQLSLAYGPDNLPVIFYVDNQITYVAHCQNILCNATLPNNGTGYYAPYINTFKIASPQLTLLNAVKSSDVVLAGVESQNDTYYTTTFCGPFVESFTPSKANTNSDTTVTVRGWSFCSNVTSSCKFGNLSVKASVKSANELTCTVNYPNKTTVNVMVGNSDWSLSSYVPGTITFSKPKHHYPNSDKIGFSMITFIMASFFIVAFLTAFIYFRHSQHKKFEAPPNIRFNFYNLMTLACIPLEFVQLLAFSTGIDAEWAHVIHQTSRSFILDIPSVPFLVIFWAVASATFLWCLYVVPFLIRTSETLLVDKLQKSGLMRILYTPAYLILIPFGTFLFFPVVNSLLGMVSCEYWNNDYSHAVLSQDTSIACWYEKHIIYSVIAFVLFYSYFPLAIILHPRLQQMSDEVDIKYDEKFLFIQSLLKLAMCVVNAAFVEFELPKVAMVAAATLLLAVVATEMKPCNVDKINSGLTAIYFGAFACAICSIWASFASSDNILPLLVLILTWMMLSIFLILSLTGYWHAFWKKKHSQVINSIARTETTPLILS